MSCRCDYHLVLFCLFCLIVIASAKEVTFCPAVVCCLSVCLSVLQCVCLLATACKKYWPDLRENFAIDVSVQERTDYILEVICFWSQIQEFSEWQVTIALREYGTYRTEYNTYISKHFLGNNFCVQNVKCWHFDSCVHRIWCFVVVHNEKTRCTVARGLKLVHPETLQQTATSGLGTYRHRKCQSHRKLPSMRCKW